MNANVHYEHTLRAETLTHAICIRAVRDSSISLAERRYERMNAGHGRGH